MVLGPTGSVPPRTSSWLKRRCREVASTSDAQHLRERVAICSCRACASCVAFSEVVFSSCAPLAASSALAVSMSHTSRLRTWIVHAKASLRTPNPPRLRYSAAAKGFLWATNECRWSALLSLSLVNSRRTVNRVPVGGALRGVDSAACDSAACLSTAARRSRAVSMVPPSPLLGSSVSMVLVNICRPRLEQTLQHPRSRKQCARGAKEGARNNILYYLILSYR